MLGLRCREDPATKENSLSEGFNPLSAIIPLLQKPSLPGTWWQKVSPSFEAPGKDMERGV
jgi:hypothetical protein